MVTASRDESPTIAPVDARRLIAVVYADMAGYSRLIGLDDAGTISRLLELRRDLIDPALARHGGVLVNTAGDSLLVTFESIISAMRFAVDVQRGVPDFDSDYAADRRVRFRMGVNVGDVVADGTNLHGEGVNIAARLQALCPPGGICVSRVVRDHVGNRIGLGFKELGAVELKNIARPIEAFLLDLEPAAAIPVTLPSPRRSRKIVASFVVVGLCLAAAVVAAFGLGDGTHVPRLASLSPRPDPGQKAEGEPPPLSIAVLPFDNLSGDPEQAYLADGISEDLTTDLSHLDNSFVIARESAFSFRGKSVDIREVGRQLGARYVVEGSVRKMNASVRINAQLIATDSGAHVWAERFDKPLADLGEGQDDIVARIGAALDVRLVNLESARQARSRSGAPAAFDLVLRARSIMLEPPSQDRDLIAVGLFLQALRIDESSVPAMMGVAAIYAGRFGSYGYAKQAADLVARAEQKAPGSPDVLVAKFILLNFEQRKGEAMDLYRHLLDVDPSATATIVQIGLCNCWTSDAEAIPLLQKTIRLNPRSASLGLLRATLARTLVLNGRAEEARELLLQSLAAPPIASPTPPPPGEEAWGERWRNTARLFLAIADVRTGRADEARQVIAEAMLAPSMKEVTVRSFMRGLREYEDPDKVAQERRFADDLRVAGLRDHLDEDADSGVPSTGALHDLAHMYDLSPMSIPGGRVVRTPEVATMISSAATLVLTTSTSSPTVPGAIFVNAPETGTLDDAWQADLKRLMLDLTHGDPHRPIIVFSLDIYRWIGRNLALRIIALGYDNVSWYRGGWEAWDASGQPKGPLAGRRNL